MMSHPSNYNHPDRSVFGQRIIYDKDMFANFSPTKNKDWLLVQYYDNVKYRFSFNGQMLLNAEDVESFPINQL